MTSYLPSNAIGVATVSVGLRVPTGSIISLDVMLNDESTCSQVTNSNSHTTTDDVYSCVSFAFNTTDSTNTYILNGGIENGTVSNISGSSISIFYAKQS